MDPLTGCFPLLAAFSLGSLVYYLWAAIALGFVIFFHELGHFAVAKWCDVKVERFSIGFGPILWRVKRGETEYALSAIPFGGYVKMLGQDDMDPSQLTQEEIAEDPRSFSAKTVPQRMAIISAGVIMNIVTGLLFFAVAFQLGVEQTPPIVGGSQVGYPAWVAGMKEGDRIDRINDRRIRSFMDIRRAVALTSSKNLVLKVTRAGGETETIELAPYSPNDNEAVSRRIIGVGPLLGLDLAYSEAAGITPAIPGSAAAKVEPPLEGDAVVVKADGKEIASYAELSAIFTAKRSETVKLALRNPGEDELVEISLDPTPFRSVGLTFEVGRIAAVQEKSPAALAGLQKDDKITHVNGKPVGNEIDPFRLPDELFAHAGEIVTIKYTREEPGVGRVEKEAQLTPTEVPGWTEVPSGEDVPLSIPSIGAAFHVIPTVLAVDEEGPAADVPVGARILEWTLVRPEDSPRDGYEGDITIKFESKKQNLAFAFWMTQQLPGRTVALTVQKGDEPKEVVAIDPVPVVADAETEEPGWYLPNDRGIRFFPLTADRKVDGFGDAFGAACLFTRDSIVDIYLTLRNVFIGELSATQFNGPVKIFQIASSVAREGMSPLLLFLGILSMNLAVINFLPIPVLDGGHMVFLIWEGVTRRKPSEGVLIASQYVGVAFVLGLICFVMYLDLFYKGG